MDWNLAIEKNREALRRVLAMLVAMAGLGAHPAAPAAGEARRILPRHLHRMILRLLRPAEAAARRLVIVAARGIVVAVPPAPSRRPQRAQPLARNGAGAGAAVPGLRHKARSPAAPSLPLIDPLPRWSYGIRRPAAKAIPRICLPGVTERFPLRPPLSANDPIDATRLARRLGAVGHVLDNLPRQAMRFARWRARACHAAAQDRLAAGRIRRSWPLRPGRPPGGRRRSSHAVHDILDVVHGLAFWVLERPDTS